MLGVKLLRFLKQGVEKLVTSFKATIPARKKKVPESSLNDKCYYEFGYKIQVLRIALHLARSFLVVLQGS